MPSQYYEIDASTGMIKRATAQAAVTATGYIGTQWDQGGAVFTDIACLVNVEAIDIASNDEVYTFRLTGSNATNRSDAQVLSVLQVGKASVITIETRDTLAGDQFIMRARTERTETAFRYIDLHLTLAGTTPSITFNAYVARMK